MPSVWKITFQLTKNEILEWIVDHCCQIKKCSLPQYDTKMSGSFIMIPPSYYHPGERIHLYDPSTKTYTTWPHTIQSIKEMEVRNE